MAAKLTPRRMSSSRGGARYTQLRVERRLLIDVDGLARWMGDYTLARIRELAAKGRGRDGSFKHLKDSTIERYESEGLDVAGTQSRLRKTGKLLDGLRYTIARIVLGATGKLNAGGATRVTVQGAANGKHAIGQIDRLRPFMGLSNADFAKALRSGPGQVPMKAKRER